MKNLLTLIVGLGSYALFLVASAYAFFFTMGRPLPSPVTLPHTTPTAAFLIDMGLMLLFGIQHSMMARPRWKEVWIRVVPPALERSLYVLTASCVLLATFWCWQPIPGIVWEIRFPLIRAIVYGVCLIGWGIVLISTFQIDHFELFGLRQMWQALRHQPQRPVEFQCPLLYRFVRHPMMDGFLLLFWAVPTMTIDRLLLALGMTIYILVGISFEERALRREFGAAYERYQAVTPQLIPAPWRLRHSTQRSLRYPNSGSVVKK